MKSTGMKRTKKFMRLIVIIVILAIYFNIGWALGTYYYYNIFTVQTPETLTQKVASGGCHFMMMGGTHRNSLLCDQILMMFFWPTILLISILSWLIYFFYQFLIYFFYYFLWLIFAGGIAKLLGIG